MEFIKIRGGNYLVKGSNGKIVDEKEKKMIENGKLSIKSASCKECHVENHVKTTATSKKNNKKKKEIVIEEPEVEVVKDESVEETDFII